MTSILKILTDREHDLDRRRTRYLATGQWVKVVQTEARIEEVGELKKTLVAEESKMNTGISTGANPFLAGTTHQ